MSAPSLQSSPLESCPLNSVKADDNLIPDDASQEPRSAARPRSPCALEGPKDKPKIETQQRQHLEAQIPSLRKPQTVPRGGHQQSSPRCVDRSSRSGGVNPTRDSRLR